MKKRCVKLLFIIFLIVAVLVISGCVNYNCTDETHCSCESERDCPSHLPFCDTEYNKCIVCKNNDDCPQGYACSALRTRCLYVGTYEEKSISSNEYCGFAKSEDGRRLSIGQDCPSGEKCVETNCVFVTRTTDAGNTYACDGVCK